MRQGMKWMAKKPEGEEPQGKGDRKGEGKRKGGKAQQEDWSWTWTNDYTDWWSWHDWGNESKSDWKGGSKESKGKEKGKSKDSGKSKGKGDYHKDEGEDRKGKSKGKSEEPKGKKGGKGYGKADGADGLRKGEVLATAKTVAEVEAEAKGKGAERVERMKRSPDSGAKQPIESKGQTCQVHKHSSMGCAVVSMQSAAMREAIMNFAEHRFGKNASGRVQMDIGEVKVQLKRHTDKQTKLEVVTDIFVAWGHQQEKDSPLTVEEIADRFDQLYQEAENSPAEARPLPASQPPSAPEAVPGGFPFPKPAPGAPGAPGVPGVPGVPGAPVQAGHPAAPNHFGAAAMNPYLQQLFAQQAAAYAYQQAYQQQLQQQQLAQMSQMYAAESKGGGKWGKGGKGYGGGGYGKGRGFDRTAAPFVPGAAAAATAAPEAAAASEGAEGDVEASATLPGDFKPAKPRLLQIVDPASGKPIDTMGMNFAPRKPSTPLEIKNPSTGQAVAIEGSG